MPEPVCASRLDPTQSSWWGSKIGGIPHALHLPADASYFIAAKSPRPVTNRADNNEEATMIDVPPNLLAAVAFGLSLAVGTPVAHAGPALSELSDVANYNQDDCAQRAQASLANDGWHGVAANGYTVTADRGPLSAVIVCL
jgi:hypothetical protein